jgi:hypothetical protein
MCSEVDKVVMWWAVGSMSQFIPEVTDGNNKEPT